MLADGSLGVAALGLLVPTGWRGARVVDVHSQRDTEGVQLAGADDLNGGPADPEVLVGQQPSDEADAPLGASFELLVHEEEELELEIGVGR